MKLPTLQEYKDKNGWQKSVADLGRPEQTLRSRLKSDKDWRVVTVGANKRCAMVDDIE